MQWYACFPVLSWTTSWPIVCLKKLSSFTEWNSDLESKFEDVMEPNRDLGSKLAVLEKSVAAKLGVTPPSQMERPSTRTAPTQNDVPSYDIYESTPLPDSPASQEGLPTNSEADSPAW